MSSEPPAPAATAAVPGPRRGAVLYPNQYAWYVLVSALDVMLTSVVINRGGREINHLAERAIGVAGLWGLIVLKFATVALVVAICETVGRRRARLGRKLAEWAVAISAVPVAVALVQLALLRTGVIPPSIHSSPGERAPHP